MEIVTESILLQNSLDEERAKGKTVGLVPTMGFLHEGHVSLIERADAENDLVVTTIFVNPLQFAPGEDLSTYPRDAERDSSLCLDAGTNILFRPAEGEMFCDDVLTSVNVSQLSSGLEGLSRPTHFSGVATVVSKLFNLSGPCRAYFGEKDWQQLQIIKRMVVDLSYKVQVIGCPIIRGVDQVALSSRNIYLNDEERKAASIIPRVLREASEKINAGETKAALVKETILDALNMSPLVSVDYVELVNGCSLEKISTIDDQTRILIAVRIGSARLIDNINARLGLSSP